MNSSVQGQYGYGAAIVDLGLFLSTMVFIRTVSVPGIGYMGNVLVNSLATLVVATGLLYMRGQSWRDLGLRRPESLLKMTGVVFVILGLVVASVVFLSPM